MDDNRAPPVGTVADLVQAVLGRMAKVIEANRRLGRLLLDLENGLHLEVAVPLEAAVDRIPYGGPG